MFKKTVNTFVENGKDKNIDHFDIKNMIILITPKIIKPKDADDKVKSVIEDL